MQNGTVQREDKADTGRALVALAPEQPAAVGERPPAPFLTQLVEARRRSLSFSRRSSPDEALKCYAGPTLESGDTPHFERVV